MNNKVKEKVLEYAKISQDLKQLTKMIGKDANEMLVATTLLTLARKGIVEKQVAKRLLADTPSVNFIDIPFNAKHISNYSIIK